MPHGEHDKADVLIVSLGNVEPCNILPGRESAPVTDPHRPYKAIGTNNSPHYFPLSADITAGGAYHQRGLHGGGHGGRGALLRPTPGTIRNAGADEVSAIR